MSPAIHPALTPPSDEWASILDEFEMYGHSRGLAVRTIEDRRAFLLRFANFVEKPPTEVTLRDLRQRLARDVSAATKQHERADLRVFYRWMLREGHVTEDPTLFLDPVRVPRRRPRPFTPEQVIAILKTARHRKTRAMVLLGLLQGWRTAEIAGARGDQFDLIEGVVKWVSKGGVMREAPIHPLVAELVPTMPAGWWFPARSTNDRKPHIHAKSVTELLTRCIRRAGITDPKLTGHSLRHTFATDLVRAGVDIRIISEMLGHANLATTSIYTQVVSSQQVEAIGKIGLQLPVELANPPKRRHRSTAENDAHAATVGGDL